jgi:hypothetical protein
MKLVSTLDAVGEGMVEYPFISSVGESNGREGGNRHWWRSFNTPVTNPRGGEGEQMVLH